MLIILVTIFNLEFIILSKRKLLDNYEVLRAGEIVFPRLPQSTPIGFPIASSQPWKLTRTILTDNIDICLQQ